MNAGSLGSGRGGELPGASQCFSSNGIVVIPPLGLFRVFVAGFDIESVVRRSLFVRARREHRDDGETNGLDGQGGRPILSQNRKADVTVAIDMRVDRNIGTEEDDDRRVKRISLREFEGKSEKVALVKSRRCAHQFYRPFRQITASLIGVDRNSGRGILA